VANNHATDTHMLQLPSAHPPSNTRRTPNTGNLALLGLVATLAIEAVKGSALF